MIDRRRPGIPTSYGVAAGDEGMLEWPDVAAGLESAAVYWVATVAPEGDPHLIPIWGTWVQEAAFIEGGDETRWARNLTGGDGHVHLGADHDGMQIMIRGVATKISVTTTLQTMIADGYAEKYPYRPEGADFWRITPEQVLAWRADTVEAFASTPTEFVFLK